MVIFNEHLCKVAQDYLTKGRKVYIEGQLQTRKWQDQSGQEKYTTEVVLGNFRGELQILDSRGGAQGDTGGGGQERKWDEGGRSGLNRRRSRRRNSRSNQGAFGPHSDA